MRDPKRIPEILNQIKQGWSAYPDLRLGQLLLNISTRCGKDLYYIEDEELVKLLRDFLQTYNKNGEN